MAIRAHSLFLVWHIVQCAGKQCSDSVGTCSSQPRTSLMQTRSLKTQALSAVEAVATRTQTLAGYKEYVNKLVAQYKQDDPGSREEIESGGDVDNAITTIIQYINSMYNDLLAWHDADLDDAKACKSTALVTACQGQVPDVGPIQEKMTLVNQTRLKHAECRSKCSSDVCDDSAACQIYNSYRKEKQANGHLTASFTDAVACANPSLDDEYIQSSPGPDEKLKQMEDCLVEAKDWLDPLYSRYIACHESEQNCEGCQVDCDRDQAAFENAHCQLDMTRDLQCTGYRMCYEDRYNECITTTCPKITVRSNARAADNETGEFIICLLGALRAKEEVRRDALRTCDDLPDTTHSDFWKIDCGHSPEEPPPMTFCGDDAYQPCDQNFLSHEYFAYRPYKDSCDPNVNDGYKECLQVVDGKQLYGSHLPGTYGMLNRCTDCGAPFYHWNPHKTSD